MVLSKKSNKKNNVGKRSMRKTRKGGKKSKMTSKKTEKKGTKKGKGGKKGKKQFRKMSRKKQKKGGELTLLDKVRTSMEPYTEIKVKDMINEYHNSATPDTTKKQLDVSFNELRFHIDKNNTGNECFYDTDYLQITLKMNASKKNAAFDESMTCRGNPWGFKQLNIADVKVPSVTWSPINIPGADTKYTFYYRKS